MKVYHPAHNRWYDGVVDKICKRTVQIYYQNDDTFTQHDKMDDKIQRMSNLGAGSDDDSDDDEPLGLVLK